MDTLVNQLKSGDWVKGKTLSDELFQGYIESVDYEGGTAKVRVVQSDNQRAIGKLSFSFLETLKLDDVYELREVGHLLNLIDLALTTKDKSWFMELTELLKEQHQDYYLS